MRVRRTVEVVLAPILCSAAGLCAGLALGATRPVAPPPYLWRIERSWDPDARYPPGPWHDAPGGARVEGLTGPRMNRRGNASVRPAPGVLDDLLERIDVRRPYVVGLYTAARTERAAGLREHWTWIGYERTSVRIVDGR